MNWNKTWIRYGVLYLSIIGVCSCKVYQSVEKIAFENTVDTQDKPVIFQTKQTWSFGSFRVSNDFDGAGLHDVKQLNDSTFVAYIKPENEPINPSPWYAFAITEDSTRIRYVILDYGKEKHRYYPKLLQGERLFRVDSSDIISLSDQQVMVRLRLSNENVMLTAQPLATSYAVHTWMDSLARTKNLRYHEYGKSKEDRPLNFLDITRGNKNKPFVVLICRQHPPEVTGWLALQYFLLEILNESTLSNDFLKQYRVLVYPLLNPDGVDHGFWRHNTGGVDLNRDWSSYHQQEIQATVSHLLKMNKQNPIVLALDFHSTYYDIFYTNDEADGPSAFPAFKDMWISALRSSLPDQTFDERASMPQSPVSKNWFYRYFGATAITYEIGDDTPDDIIELKGRTTAKEMMKILVGD